MNKTYNMENSNRIVTFGNIACPLKDIMNDPWNYMLLVGDEPKQIACRAVSRFFRNLFRRFSDHYFHYIELRYS